MQELGLAQFIDTPDGITAKDACNFAGLKLELLREKALAEVDDALDALAGYMRLIKRQVPPRVVELELHRLSCSILNIAGTFGLHALGRAAHSFCLLLDWFGESGKWDRVSVDVHMDAMRLLRHPETVATEMQEHLLKGLNLVVDRHGQGGGCIDIETIPRNGE